MLLNPLYNADWLLTEFREWPLMSGFERFMREVENYLALVEMIREDNPQFLRGNRV
jgi:hypothetical protein